MQSGLSGRWVVVLGTGGTIAGTAARADDTLNYRAAQLGVNQLVAAVPPLAGVPLQAEQVAQLDSKDMDVATWLLLARRAAQHLARDDVAAVVVTHGTDTLEETAWFLHRVLAPSKPLVLTAAMRPASSLQADGPQNLLDAVTVALTPGARGVVAVLAGVVHGADDLRKVHGHRIDAFSSGDAGPVARVEDGRLRMFRPWSSAPAHAADVWPVDAADWPAVDIVTSHAGARGETIDALVAAGAKGLVIAGTGNGTLHHALAAAAQRAVAAGVRVVRASRCGSGGVVASAADELPTYGPLTPVQARIELQLDLLLSTCA
jgi:L-asparaginase